MKWRELYEKCNHKMYCRITEIKEPLHISANFKNFYKNNKLTFLITIIIIFALIVLTFHSHISQILLASFFTLLLLILFFYNNSYNLHSDKDSLKVNFGTATYEINFDDLLNIYLDKHKSKYVVFTTEYTINIIFKQGDDQMILSLPTYLLTKKDVKKFFNSIECVELEQQKELEKEEAEHKNMLKAIVIITALVLLVIFITTVIVLLFRK